MPLSLILILREKCRIGSYSGTCFPAFGLNTENVQNIKSECGKIRTRITPNTDTYFAVLCLYETKNCKCSLSEIIQNPDL